MDAEEFRKTAHAVIDDVISYFTSLPTLRVTPTIKPGYLAPLLPHFAPETPDSPTSLLTDIRTKILPGLTHWQSPNFHAFFPATATYPSILGEIYSAAFTAPAFNWLCSPACTELETIVLDWVASMQGLPDCFRSDGPSGGGGVIQGSASEAVVPVMVAAREGRVRRALESEGLEEVEGESEERRLRREDRAAEIRGKLVAIASEQAHSLVQKGANILGCRFRAVSAGRETGYCMTASALREKIAEVEAQGLEVFFVTITMGTTATCAVDDLEGVAALKKERGENLWVHVDAAYAGAALCCEEVRGKLGGEWLGEFDSFDFNMHKWMLVNFDASLLYLRDRTPLTTAMSISPSYLQNPAAIKGLVTDYRDWQIPLGRRFRAIKIWFVLRTYGVSGIQKLIRKHIALGEYFAGLVRERSDLLEIVAGPAFALTVIRCVAPLRDIGQGNEKVIGAEEKDETRMNGFESKRAAADDVASNALTKEVCDLINSRGNIFLTGALISGKQCVRVVSANELADEAHVKKAFEIIVATTEEVLVARVNKTTT